MPDPQIPSTIQLSLSQLWAIVATASSPIALLLACLWTLTIERIKKTETRLDDGSKTINGLKVSVAEHTNDIDHIVLSMRDHYQSSDEYRHETDEKIAEAKSEIKSIKTRCQEREKAGKP
jgi:peptidoglycan hydrolase CwlO-like protein